MIVRRRSGDVARSPIIESIHEATSPAVWGEDVPGTLIHAASTSPRLHAESELSNRLPAVAESARNRKYTEFHWALVNDDASAFIARSRSVPCNSYRTALTPGRTRSMSSANERG